MNHNKELENSMETLGGSKGAITNPICVPDSVLGEQIIPYPETRRAEVGGGAEAAKQGKTSCDQTLDTAASVGATKQLSTDIPLELARQVTLFWQAQKREEANLKPGQARGSWTRCGVGPRPPRRCRQPSRTLSPPRGGQRQRLRSGNGARRRGAERLAASTGKRRNRIGEESILRQPGLRLERESQACGLAP